MKRNDSIDVRRGRKQVFVINDLVKNFPRDSFPFGHFFCLVTDREINLYSGTVDHMRSINYIATTVNRVEGKSSSGNTG